MLEDVGAGHCPPAECGRCAREGDFTVIARPVIWNGKVSKVAVVAVPDGDLFRYG